MKFLSNLKTVQTIIQAMLGVQTPSKPSNRKHSERNVCGNFDNLKVQACLVLHGDSYVNWGIHVIAGGSKGNE